jgi:hypothetical protein
VRKTEVEEVFRMKSISGNVIVTHFHSSNASSHKKYILNEVNIIYNLCIEAIVVKFQKCAYG